MSNRMRLFPIVIVTAITVLGLKIADYARKNDLSIASINVALAQEKPAEEKSKADDKKKAEMKPGKDEKKKGKDKKKGGEAPVEQSVTSLSQSEVALLEALSKRRKELDSREKEIKLRENLLKAAEKRIDEKISNLQKIEAQIQEATVKQKKMRNEQFKNLVSIYEGMKPKEAARIFSRLDGKILLQVAGRIAPRKMSAILAKMDAEAAERLTIQLAMKAAGDGKSMKELPRVEDGKSG